MLDSPHIVECLEVVDDGRQQVGFKLLSVYFCFLVVCTSLELVLRSRVPELSAAPHTTA